MPLKKWNNFPSDIASTFHKETASNLLKTCIFEEEKRSPLFSRLLCLFPSLNLPRPTAYETPSAVKYALLVCSCSV